MRKGIPEDVRWLIEAKVRMAGEIPVTPEKRMPGMGKSTYAKKRRAKQVKVGCHKCARIYCNSKCRSLGMVSDNREGKIQFIKDGLRRESLDDIRLSLDAHPSGYMQGELSRLWNQFRKEQQRYSLGNLTLKDPVCQSLRKLDGK